MTPNPHAPQPPTTVAQRPTRVCFFFNAQRHQLLHGLSTAVALARMEGFEVHVLSPDAGHVTYARKVVDALGGAPVVFSLISPALVAALREKTGAAWGQKIVGLGLAARHLNQFDAIALPERTSIALKRFGAPTPRYIHLDHGAGDRAAGFDPRIAAFDMVLMAGEKHRERMTRERLIHPGRYAVVGYPKFEAADAIRDTSWRPFANGRPTVLYNPHFSKLGSWKAFGEAMLKAFAAQDRYNLIVAPHVRMLDGTPAKARWRGLVEAYAGCDHILIDTGGDACVDMTYTTLADIYVGDVSSQVYEFLRTPRPCLFLDAHGVDWRGDENYAHWRFGPVAGSPEGLLEAVDGAVRSHAEFRTAQADGFAQTFAAEDRPPSQRASLAIADYLTAAGPRATRASWFGPTLTRAAGLVLAVAAGRLVAR